MPAERAATPESRPPADSVGAESPEESSAVLLEPGADGDFHEQVRQQTETALSGSAVLVASKAATWGLAFVMTVMMPRYLGAAQFGRLYTAMSVTGIMAILVEFGLNSLVAREVARDRTHAIRYLVNAAILKGLLWVLGAVGLAVMTRVAGYPPQTQTTAAILALSVLFISASSIVVAVLQANDQMRWIAASTIAEKGVYVGLGVAALVMGYGIVAIATVMMLGSLAGLLLDLWWLRVLSRRVDLRTGWTGFEVRTMFVRALPFFTVLFFGAIYFRIDVVIMSFMSTDAQIGSYGAAYRLFQTTYMIPEAFTFALVPLFSRLSVDSRSGLTMAAQKGLDVLLLVGIPMAVAMALLADEIVATLYGLEEFSAAVPVLAVLGLAVVLMFANSVFVQLLIATDRQKRLATTAGIAAAFNVGANLALIPILGALGAAITTVATEALIIGLNYAFLPRELTASLLFRTPIKALGAAGVMGIVLMLLDGRSLLLLVPLGALVYIVALVVFRVVPAEDRAMMRAALGRMGAS